MHKFDEHHAELTGFSDYYHTEIFPILASRDSVRREAVRKTKLYSAWIIGIAFIAVLFLFRVNSGPVMFVAFVAAAAIIGIYQWQTKTVKASTKDAIVGGVCKFIGWRFMAEVTEPPALDYWSHLGLMPKGFAVGNKNAGSRASFEDELQGEAHGAQFRSREVHLERRGKNSYHTVMRGQMLSIMFPRKFTGRTVVLRDKGSFQRKKRDDMKRVGLVDPVFERIFEAYSTDQVEARYILTPDFMQTLVDLEASVNGKNIRFGFVEGQLLIVVETSNRYEAGSMFQPLTTPDRTQKVLDEVGAIYDVIDAVLAPKAQSLNSRI